MRTEGRHRAARRGNTITPIETMSTYDEVGDFRVGDRVTKWSGESGEVVALAWPNIKVRFDGEQFPRSFAPQLFEREA